MHAARSFALAGALVAASTGALSRAAVPAAPIASQAVRPWATQPSTRLQAILDAAVRATRDEFAPSNLRDDELATTLIDLRNPARAESRERERRRRCALLSGERRQAVLPDGGRAVAGRSAA